MCISYKLKVFVGDFNDIDTIDFVLVALWRTKNVD